MPGVSQRGNNDMSEMMVTSRAGAPDVNQFIQGRKDARSNPQTPLEEKRKYYSLKAPQQPPTTGSVLDMHSLPTQFGRFKIEFNGSLTQWQKSGEKGVQWLVPEVNQWIFQNLGSDGTPSGNLTKVIPVKAHVSHIKSTLPFDTCVTIPGMKGNFRMKNGMQSPVHIPCFAPGTDPTLIKAHKLDSQQMRLAELHMGSITEEALLKEITKLDIEFDKEGNPMPQECLVPRHGEIVRVLTRPKNLESLGIDLDEFELVRRNRFCCMELALAELCVNSVLAKQKDIKLEHVNHFKWPIGLLKEDGMPWSEVDMDPSITTQGEVLSDYTLKKHHQVSFMLHYRYVIASGKEWDQALGK